MEVTKPNYTEIMSKRVARFEDLEGFSEGHVDDDVAGAAERVVYNVMGFEDYDPTPFLPNLIPWAPVGEVGKDKGPIKDGQGINLAYVELPPGEGVIYHMHDTNETFIMINGRMKFFWGEGEGEFVEIGPRDVISFPGPVPRRFVNIGEETSLFLAINAGYNPRALIDPKMMKEAEENTEGAAIMPEGYY